MSAKGPHMVGVPAGERAYLSRAGKTSGNRTSAVLQRLVGLSLVDSTCYPSCRKGAIIFCAKSMMPLNCAETVDVAIIRLRY